MTKTYDAIVESIPEIQKQVRKFCEIHKYNKKTIFEYELLTEEINVKLIEAAEEDSKITVRTQKHLGSTKIEFSCPGDNIDFEKAAHEDPGLMILLDYSERFSQTRKHGINHVALSTNTSSNVMLKQNVAAAILAIATGYILILALDESQLDFIENQIAWPVALAFIKLLQNLALPVAFLSLVAYLINFHSAVEYDSLLKKISVKFFISSSVAVAISFGIWGLLMYGLGLSEMNNVTTTAFKAQSADNFLGNTLGEIIQNTIPSNLLELFTNSNPIPMLIFAVLLGFGINSYSSNSNERLRQAVNDLSKLVTQILNMIFSTMPIFFYFALLDVILWGNINDVLKYSLIDLAIVVALVLLVFLLHFIFYIFQLVIAGISPVAFFRKYGDMVRENFHIASNIEALPYNVRTFKLKLGRKVDQSIVKSTLRLGSDINMDGNCLIITISILTMSKLWSVQPDVFILVEVLIVILMLGIGSPNQPGSFTISCIVLADFLGIDVSIYTTIIILEAIFCKLYSSVNAIGDIITVVIIADDELRTGKKRLYNKRLDLSENSSYTE